MAKLSAKARRNLPGKTFAGPHRSFPIPDKKHAKAALMLIGHAPAGARAKIRARAHAELSKRYGGKVPGQKCGGRADRRPR